MARRDELDLLEQDATAAPPQDEPAREPGQAPEVPVSPPFQFRNLLQSTLGRFKGPGVAFSWKSLLDVPKNVLSRIKNPETPFSWKSLLDVPKNVLSRIKNPETPFSWKTLLNIPKNILSRFNDPETPFSWKSLLSWKILVPAGIAVVLIAVGSVFYIQSRQEEAAQMAAEKAKQMASVLVVHEAVFPDFSIDIKDARGQYRFLQCDVTLEFQAGVELTEDRKAEIRKVIYRAAQKKGQELIQVSDAGSRLKNEMHGELRDLLGEGALKNIYFTRYVLI
jgi:flagellar basal body-associated protein FliL